MDELKDVASQVSVEFVVGVILVLIALFVIGYKVVPVLMKGFEHLRTQTNKYEELVNATLKNTKDIELIKQKIGRDYARINQIEQLLVRQQAYIEDSLEESELILKSLLGVIQGLQEMGANGPTKTAASEIQAYLLEKSHRVHEDS